jgi:hypothetical protein
VRVREHRAEAFRVARMEPSPSRANQEAAVSASIVQQGRESVRLQ